MALFVSHAEAVPLGAKASASAPAPEAAPATPAASQETYAAFMERLNSEEHLGCQLTEPIATIGAKMGSDAEATLNARLKESLSKLPAGGVEDVSSRLAKLEARLSEMPTRADLDAFTDNLATMRSNLGGDVERISARLKEVDGDNQLTDALEKLSARMGDFEKLSADVEQLKSKTETLSLGAKAGGNAVDSPDMVLMNAKLDFMRDRLQEMNTPEKAFGAKAGDASEMELMGKKLDFMRDRLRSLEEGKTLPVGAKAGDASEMALIGKKLDFMRDRLRAVEEGKSLPVGAKAGKVATSTEALLVNKKLDFMRDRLRDLEAHTVPEKLGAAAGRGGPTLHEKVEFMRDQMLNMQNEINLAVGKS